MRIWRHTLLLFVASCSVAATAVGWASPITYDFDVLVPLIAGGIETLPGTFTYDSSSVPTSLPGDADQAGLLTNLAFVFHGVSYDETTANTGGLSFNAAGVLDGALFGNDCAAGFCSLAGIGDQWLIELFIHPFSGALVGIFSSNVSGEGMPPVTVEVTGPIGVGGVPEPTTLALLGIGLAGLGFSRRARTQPSIEFTPQPAPLRRGFCF